MIAFSIKIIAVGLLKKGPELELYNKYLKRLRPPPQLIELKDDKLLVDLFRPLSCCILDEKGQNFTTLELSKFLSENPRLTFFIGGADGLPSALKQQAKHSISFGSITWPHLLVRALLVEQIYRCQQLLNGHPYHRE